MSVTDEASGVFDVIDTEASAHDPIDQTEVSETAQAEGAEAEDQGSSAETTEVETKDSSTSDEGQNSTETQTEEPSKTENTEQDVSNWKETLPPPPPTYNGIVPQFDETGAVVNMNPQQYQDYIIAKASEVNRLDNYNNFVENRALDVAEKILPELKSSPAIRQLVESTRLASLYTDNPIDTVQAAQQVREALGIAPDKLAAARTEGANNTKASITVQKNAALETGSSQKKTPSKSSQEADLVNRVKRGDSNAFAELLSSWEKDGVI